MSGLALRVCLETSVGDDGATGSRVLIPGSCRGLRQSGLAAAVAGHVEHPRADHSSVGRSHRLLEDLPRLPRNHGENFSLMRGNHRTVPNSPL